jgi:hypothetical protein
VERGEEAEEKLMVVGWQLMAREGDRFAGNQQPATANFACYRF